MRLVVFAFAVALAAFPGASLARAQIYMPGTQPAGHDGGVETPIQSSGSCTMCHGRYDPADDYEPWDGWRGTMMGNSTRDPVFRAALAIAEEDHPDAADFCVRCHSLGAWMRGRSTVPEWSEAEGPRFVPDEDGFPSSELDGVACQVCHRATADVPSDPAAPYASNSQIYLYDGAQGAVRTGPYSYAPGEEPTHQTVVSDFLPTGDFCAQCHDIVNPVVMGQTADGTPTGRLFAIERTYSEWRNSAFAARGETCQDCHMREVGEPVRASIEGGLRDYVRRHDLVGSSSWVPRALAATVPDSDGDWSEALERTASKSEAFMTEAASLEVTDVGLVGESISATVRVTNLTGHKLPTGYPEGRRMWLEVAVVDGTGEVVRGSGLYDPATATLDHDDQLRTYEAELGEGGVPSFHFVLNDTVLSDTRIPPEGFAAPEELDIRPVGRDYGDGAGGYRHWDEVAYELEACGEGELSLRVRLLFQSTTREYIEFLRDNAPDSPDPAITNWGAISYQLWNDHGGRLATTMAESTTALGASPGPCPEPPPDAGTDAGADAGSDAGADAGMDAAVDSGTTPPPADDGGCGCAVPAGPSPGPLAPLGAAALLALILRRRLRP